MDLNEIDYFPDEFDDIENQVLENEEHINESYTNTKYEFEENEPNDSFEEDENVIDALLKSKGINPNAIKFENESGEIEEVSFDSLSTEEQLQVLGYEELDDNYGLEDEEVNFINQLRLNNLSIQEYNNYIAQLAIKQYIESQGNVQNFTEIDLIPDDELYLADLTTRIPNLSDEEAHEELEAAKANPNLYSKKIQSLRDEYKQREEDIKKQEESETLAKQQAEAEEFERVIIEAIDNNAYMGSGDSTFELNVDDKNELASFILDSDPAGIRYLAKALQKPDVLVKMAWYALKGEEAFSQISEYYKKEISKTAKANYQKGYEDARSGKSATKSVVRKPVNRQDANKTNLTINDIDL